MIPVKVLPLMRALALSITTCCMVLPVQRAEAGSFSLKPVQVHLDAGNSIARMTVQNTGDAELHLELKPYQWRQNAEGRDEYEAAGNDIVVFPRMVTLRGGEERIIRLGSKQKPGAIEKTYRLFIEEIPLPLKGAPKTTSVRLLMKATVPVFMAPSGVDDRGAISSLSLAQGTLSITIKNEGNRHWFIQSVSARGFHSAGEPFDQELNGWYLLAGASRTYSLQIPEKVCRNLTTLDIEVRTDRFGLKGKLDVDKQLCGP